jgi:hypothetical protein
MRKYFSLLMALTFLGCSNLSKNIVDEGTFFLSNGIFADKTWKEDLKFERYSWYHELTMQFDLMVAKVSPQSGFNFWFSKDEIAAMNSCKEALLVFAYSQDTKIIPYSILYDQFDQKGFTRIELPEFKRQLFQHPDTALNSLKLYHILGFCRKDIKSNQLLITFPGYSEKYIK